MQRIGNRLSSRGFDISVKIRRAGIEQSCQAAPHEAVKPTSETHGFPHASKMTRSGRRSECGNGLAKTRKGSVFPCGRDRRPAAAHGTLATDLRPALSPVRIPVLSPGPRPKDVQGRFVSL